MQVPFPAASHPSKTTSVGTWAARSARWSSPMRISRGSWTVRYSLWERERERARGSARRGTATGAAHGELCIGGFVDRSLAYDPDAPPLAMKDPGPMRAPDGAPKETGMAYVPAGEFVMGSERGEIDEEPRHVVY